MQPILETPRLRLEPARSEHLETLFALWTDPDVRRFLWDDVAIEREKARETLRSFEDLGARGLGLWVFATRNGTSDPIIGCAGLSPVGASSQYYSASAGAVEPIVALAPQFWHQGYAQEAVAVLVDYAIRTLKLNRLVGATDVPNVRSDRLLRRLSFVPCAETDGPRYRLRHYRYGRI